MMLPTASSRWPLLTVALDFILRHPQALHSEGFGKRQDTNRKKAGLDTKQGEGKAGPAASAKGVKTGVKKAGGKGKAGVGARPKKAKPTA